MTRHPLILFYLILLTPLFMKAQSSRPSVVFQNGFSANIGSYFDILPGNNFILGSNEAGEYLLWDINSAKIVKKFAPFRNEIPELLYMPVHAVSGNGKFVLMPLWPSGHYFLYDIAANKNLCTFIPPIAGELYTHAIFKEDSKVILVAQVTGKPKYCTLRECNFKGEVLKTWELALPPMIGNETVNFIAGKMFKPFQKLPNLRQVMWDDASGNLFFTFISNNLLSVRLSSLAQDQINGMTSYSKVLDTLKFAPLNLTMVQNKLVIREEPRYEKKGKAVVLKQNIHVIRPGSGKVEKTVESSMALLDTSRQTNGIFVSITGSNRSGSVYYQLKSVSDSNFTFVAKDLLTEREIFTYNNGEPFFWYTAGKYKTGQLNGGLIMDVSSDQQLIAECSRELLIHNLKTGKLKAVIPINRGNIKLNSPLFIDSTTLLIPKITNDAFIFDMKNGLINRLKSTLECNDTVRNGANMIYFVKNDAQIGLKNACLSPDGKSIATFTFVPNIFCDGINNKVIEVWDTKTKVNTGKYTFTDDQFTWYSAMLPGQPATFLVNHKLVQFPAKDSVSVKELKIIQKKDTFYAFSPLYREDTKTIFCIMGTRNIPGEEDLIFAHFDLSGKLIDSHRYPRKRSKMKYQTLLTEVQVSPDKNKILFCHYDGTGGIYDLKQNKVIFTFEHGKGIHVNIMKLHSHTAIISACFTDNDRFVTCGNDGAINLWHIGDVVPVKRLNEEPYMMYSITASPDGRYLVGTDVEKAIKFIDLKTGNTDASFIALNPATYALTTREGYYLSNKNLSNGLWFFYNGKTYDFSQFDLNLNRPDKVLQTLGYASPGDILFFERAYRKRLDKLGYKPSTSPDLITFDAPEVSLNDLPEERQETTLAELNFTVTGQSTSAIINRLFITVNGVPLYGSGGRKINQAKSNDVKIPVSIQLTNGKNLITVSMMNENGTESLREYIDITRTGTSAKANLFLIAIGAGKFSKDKENNLTYPAKDATDIISLFNSSKLFNNKNIYEIKDEKVSRENILKLKEVLKKSRPEDFVILFYAGHGLLDKNKDYFLSTFATNFSNPSEQTSIAYKELENLLDDIPARHKIMLLDACYSGELDKENIKEIEDSKTTYTEDVITRSTDSPVMYEARYNGMANSFELMQTLFSDIRMTNGASIIASSRGTEKSLEENTWNNGAFTHCLIRGLKEKRADLNANGEISVSELITYLRIEVPALTQGLQLPVSRTENLVNDFIIWK